LENNNKEFGAFYSERREWKPKAWVWVKTLNKSQGTLPSRY
jgi:hypothetical protein